MKNKDKFISKGEDFFPIKNDTLMCNDCMFVMNVSGVCRKYPLPTHKPLNVLNGGKCEKYVKIPKA